MPHHARLPLWHDKSDIQKLDTLHQLVMDLYRYQLDEHLSQIIAMLDTHQPADEKERNDVQLIKELIREHPNIINMNCEIGHITASAIVVNIKTHKILLHFHKRLNRWLQVGGHASYEIDMAIVALREAQEETGLPDLAFYPSDPTTVPIDYDVHTIPQRGDIPEHLHLDFRYVLTTSQPTQLAPESGESHTFRWLTFAEALALENEIDPALQRLIYKVQVLFDKQ